MLKKISLIAFIIGAFMTTSEAQPTFGFGFRVGDISGISLKSNFGESAVEVSLGRLARFGNPDRQLWFYNFKDYDEDHYDYRFSEMHVPLALQAHYLRHRPIDFAEPMRWYYGIGAQARMYPVTYTVRDYQDGSTLKIRRKTWEMGLDWILGIEHNFENVPIGLFMDVLLYMELHDSPFVVWGQFGVGARYNF